MFSYFLLSSIVCLRLDFSCAGAMEMIRAAGESTFPRDEKIGYFKFKALTTMLLNAPSLDQAMELHAEILKFKSLVPEVDAGAVHSAYVKRVMEEYVCFIQVWVSGNSSSQTGIHEGWCGSPHIKSRLY